MVKFLNYMVFFGNCLIAIPKALKQLIPAWNDLKEANEKNEMLDELKKEVTNENR